MATISDSKATTQSHVDGDVALQFLAGADQISFTEEESRRVKRKIDMRLLPILCLTFGLQYLDKVTVSYAAVYGMRQDLHLVGSEYSWTSSIFYFGYLVAQGPSAYLLTKFPVGKYAAVNIFLWGIMVLLCAVTKSFSGMAALRFLMGVFESAIGPCWVTMMGMFYRNNEQGARVTSWYGFVGLAAIIGGLLSYGVGKTHSDVSQWKIVFLICGGFTVLWSVLVWFFLPSSPTTAYFLNERERHIAVERLRINRTGLRTNNFKWNQAMEALVDPQCIIIALWAGISNICNIAGSFLPLIIQDMGFSGLTTTLLTLPVGGVEIVAMIVAGFFCSHIRRGRTIIMFIVASPTLAGIAMLQALPLSNNWGRCAGVWLVLCVPASYAVLLSLVSSNVAGFSKKLMTTSMVFVSFCVGNIVSPQLFISTEAPGYRTGVRAMLVAIILCQILSLALGLYYYFENKRRDKMVERMLTSEVVLPELENEEFLDRTDKEDWVKFRYEW
ncbi:major facilitator superfamily transporter [Seiridium cupressi]